MAKITFAAPVAEARGKVGGIVYSRNTWGAYIRNKVSPVQPRTPAQNLIRAKMTQMAERWRDVLTSTQRLAWELYAELTTKMLKVLGRTGLNGITAYTRYNVEWTRNGGTPVDVAPFTPGEAPMCNFTLTGTDADGVQITACAPTLAAGDIVFIYCNKPLLPQSRNFFNGPWALKARIESTSTFPLTVVPGSDVNLGQRWFLKLRYFDSKGRVGPYATKCVDILT